MKNERKTNKTNHQYKKYFKFVFNFYTLSFILSFNISINTNYSLIIKNIQNFTILQSHAKSYSNLYHMPSFLYFIIFSITSNLGFVVSSTLTLSLITHQHQPQIQINFYLIQFIQILQPQNYYSASFKPMLQSMIF